jgi:hypothetical protein
MYGPQGGAECSQRVRVTAFQSERTTAAAARAEPTRSDSVDSQLAAALAASAAGAPCLSRQRVSCAARTSCCAGQACSASVRTPHTQRAPTP